MNHLGDLLKLFTTTYRHKTLLRYMDRTPEEQWHEWSGEQLAEQTMLAAQALVRAGVQPGDRVAIYSQNMMEGIITELGLMAIRAICVPLYATCSPEQVAYITEHAEVKLILVGEQRGLYVTRLMRGASTLRPSSRWAMRCPTRPRCGHS